METQYTKGPWQIKHSESKDAWNVIGTVLGGKYKIARFPYHVIDDIEITETSKQEAYADALMCSKAPELFDILKRLCDKLDQVELSDDTTEEIVPLIAEADEIMQAATTIKTKDQPNIS